MGVTISGQTVNVYLRDDGRQMIEMSMARTENVEVKLISEESVLRAEKLKVFLAELGNFDREQLQIILKYVQQIAR